MSFQIIGCLFPVLWGTHGSEILLTHFLYNFLIYTCIIFFLVFPFIFPSQSHSKFPWPWPGYASRTWVHGKVPLSLDWPMNGLVLGLKGPIFWYLFNIGIGAPFTSKVALSNVCLSTIWLLFVHIFLVKPCTVYNNFSNDYSLSLVIYQWKLIVRSHSKNNCWTNSFINGTKL